MGDQKDVLEGMTKFSGNDGAVVWPMWKDDLMNRVKFELGTVAHCNILTMGRLRE